MVASGIAWACDAEVSLKPSQPTGIDWSCDAELTARPGPSGIDWSCAVDGYFQSAQFANSTPISDAGIGVAALTGLGGPKLRLTLWRPDSARSRRPTEIGHVDIRKPPKNEAIVFRPTGTTPEYMAPILCTLKLLNGSAAALGSAILTLRWRKRPEED